MRAILFLTLLCSPALAMSSMDNLANPQTDDDKSQEEARRWEKCQEILVPACEEYLEAFSTEAERAEWNKRIDERIAQKREDNPSLDQGACLREIALDWAAGNEARIRKKDPRCVKLACMMFVRFSSSGEMPPMQMRDNLKIDKVTEFSNYLKEEVEKKHE